jgi:hypothetical protein
VCISPINATNGKGSSGQLFLALKAEIGFFVFVLVLLLVLGPTFLLQNL